MPYAAGLPKRATVLSHLARLPWLPAHGPECYFSNYGSYF